MEQTCAGCLEIIPNREYLTCMLCSCKYDLKCASISFERFKSFYSTPESEHRKAWKCPSCRCKEPKGDNSNTPVRLRDNDEACYRETYPETSNITLRKRPHPALNITPCFDESSILGDTLHADANSTTSQQGLSIPSNIADTITLEKFEKLLDKKLETNRQSLISELKITLLSEINKAMTELRNEIAQTNNTIKSEQDNHKQAISKINNTIISIEKEHKKIKTEVEEINKITAIFGQASSSNKAIPVNCTHCSEYKNEICQKKLVLYGLQENHWENESELYDRILYVFQDILNVNLVEYIEACTRIGRKGQRRPIVIELLSKKVTKYLLNNKAYFKNTGVWISEFLDQESLKSRHTLKKTLYKARQEGHHAVIKNNKIYINGKLVEQHDQSHTNLLKSSPQDNNAQNSTDLTTINTNNTTQSKNCVENVDHFFRK
ncbi:uncharacterized protein LOC134658506 [Cydia amplana]|uniref:uncharacterized protein LOC134658506 n=1 Tax=Cydia amplana TaxID=1869771 RepID=UPI002FE5D33D